MKKTAYRFYWERGSGKESIELMAMIIAPDIATAVSAFASNFPDHPLKDIRSIETMMEQVVIVD